jgi:hypothetical protein
VQRTCDGGLNQVYRLRDAGSGYSSVLAQISGKCLDVSSASTSDGACHPLERLHRLVNRNSGKCLDVSGVSASDGARLVQWSCGGGLNQQFARSAA